MKDWESLAILQGLRHEQRQREMAARFYQPRRRAACLEFERNVTRRVMARLTEFGPVNLTTHKAPFDAWVDSVRVEIKAANWTSKAGDYNLGRYQANIRNSDYDVLLFVAVNGTDHYFVIPKVEIGNRQHIAITQYRVEQYTGQWAAYLEAWYLLRRAVAAAPPRPIQLGFN